MFPRRFQCCVALALAVLLGSTALGEPKTLAPAASFRAYESYIESLAITPDGRYALTTGSLKNSASQLNAFELPAGRRLNIQIELEAGQNEPIAAAPDNAHFAYARAFRGGYVADLRTGATRLELKHNGEGFSFAKDMQFTPDLKAIVCGIDKEIVGWSTASGQQLFSHKVSEANVVSLCVLPGSSAAAIGDREGRVLIVDLRTGKVAKQLSDKTSQQITAVAASTDGKTLASYTFDAQGIQLWDLASGKKLRMLDASRPTRVEDIVFTPDGKSVIAQGRWEDLTKETWPIFMWDIATGERSAILDGQRDNFTSLALSKDGRRLVSGGQGGIVHVWDLSDVVGQPIQDAKNGGEGGGASNTTDSPDSPDTPPAEALELPRYKVAEHTTRGQTLTAKVWIDTPGGKLPSVAQVAGVWAALAAKTDKRLVLHFYVPGMKLPSPPWAVGTPGEQAQATVRTFDTRAPEKFRP